MTDASPSLGKLVPGFEFLQNLAKNATSALPNIGQWVAPTLNPEELEKRIEELRTVQFWLEQNARMLAATIQALEVQRMTLSTLQTMNVHVGDLRDAMTLKPPSDGGPDWQSGPFGQALAASAAKQGGAPPATARPAPARPRARSRTATPRQATPAAAGATVDPMQWWGALTQQFTQLATHAMKDAAGQGAKTLATEVVRQSFKAADETLRKNAGMARDTATTLAGMPVRAAQTAARQAGQVARGVASASAAARNRATDTRSAASPPPASAAGKKTKSAGGARKPAARRKPR